ncbi:MAG: hypothetical protein AAF311_02130 [Pseudomonadota bacterium]
MSLAALMALAACGADVGADRNLLIGAWAQEGVTQTDPALVVEDAVVAYAPDGTSTFEAVMTFTQHTGVPERFAIRAGVDWTLEETVLIRTLREVAITPDISTPEGEALARALEDAYRNSPPGRLIVEELTEERLSVLDADTGTTLSYRRRTGQEAGVGDG